MNKEEYISKWLTDSLSEDEKAFFETSGEFEDVRKLDVALQSFKAPDFDIEKELDDLNERRTRPGKVVRMPWMQTMVRVAAVLLVIISGYFFFYLNINTQIETIAGEKQKIELPDGSVVVLNAHSQVVYKENMWKYNREVLLEGEAYFEVAKGATFAVSTEEGIVRVLGTEFNVNSRESYFDVTCYEGSVEVESADQTIRLTANEAFRVINGQQEKYNTDTGAQPGWLDKTSAFRSVPYREVLNELERQYDVTLEIDQLDTQQLFTGSFQHDDLRLALEAITAPLNIDYQIISEKNITLTGQGD